jgi:hypothetical protein
MVRPRPAQASVGSDCRFRTGCAVGWKIAGARRPLRFSLFVVSFLVGSFRQPTRKLLQTPIAIRMAPRPGADQFADHIVHPRYRGLSKISHDSDEQS